MDGTRPYGAIGPLLTAAQLAVGAGLALAILVLMEIDKALGGRYTPCARAQTTGRRPCLTQAAPRSSAPRRPPGDAVASRVTTPPSEWIERDA
jgi:hypothetical protein